MDYALAFGVGRQTAIRPNDITQTLPTEEDIHPNGNVDGAPTSPFIYAAKMMKSYGHLINMLNVGDSSEGGNMEGDINQARAQAMAAFNELPEDMQWNVGKWVLSLLSLVNTNGQFPKPEQSESRLNLPPSTFMDAHHPRLPIPHRSQLRSSRQKNRDQWSSPWKWKWNREREREWDCEWTSDTADHDCEQHVEKLC